VIWNAGHDYRMPRRLLRAPFASINQDSHLFIFIAAIFVHQHPHRHPLLTFFIAVPHYHHH
jgi:hypothetical protein